MATMLAIFSGMSLVAWVYLVMGRGWFWRADQELAGVAGRARVSSRWPSVSVVIPARDEADVLPRTLPTVLEQDYPGRLHVFLVDDHSRDGTPGVASRCAHTVRQQQRLNVLQAPPLPSGWSGKLWAVSEGVKAAAGTGSEYLLLTDADIAHPAHSLNALVAKARGERLQLVSVMARLRVETFWERFLIPAFVYFFALISPFRWVNDPDRRTAAAAGGCVLVRRDALERAGGIESIAGELIDDCALSRRIKDRGRPWGGRIWLGFSDGVTSVRPHGGLKSIWEMVARTGFAQLNYSLLLLVATVLGMTLVFVVPPLSVAQGVFGPGVSHGLCTPIWLAAGGIAAWAMMSGSYLPMLRRYGVCWGFSLTLPVVALLYTFMTIDSAWRFFRGRGGAWKGRIYGT